MPRTPEQEILHSRAKRRGNALAKRALPPLRVSSLSTTDLGRSTYRLLVRALRAEVKRLQATGSLDLGTLGEAGKVLELLTSGHATLEVKPSASTGMVSRTLTECFPADLPRLMAAARGEPGVWGGEAGTQAGGAPTPGGHFLSDGSDSGSPENIGESPQPEAK